MPQAHGIWARLKNFNDMGVQRGRQSVVTFASITTPRSQCGSVMRSKTPTGRTHRMMIGGFPYTPEESSVQDLVGADTIDQAQNSKRVGVF